MIRPAVTILASLFLTVTADAALELAECRISAGPSFPSIKARCGVLARPENPDDPNSPQIELRVAVVPALNLQPEPDPIVPIAGGPGQSTVQFYSAYSAAFEPLRRDRDILLIDQRGTGESARMDCSEDLIEGQYSREQIVEYTETCLQDLPHDPRYFTTSVAVKDLEAVRQSLGYASLNLYGVSYGTRVVQHYARRYPEATRTIVLDGVVPPQIVLGPDIALESQHALDDIFARCGANPACNERYPNLAERFTTLKTKLEKKPAKIKVAHPLSGKVETVSFGRDELAGAIRLLAYHPNSIALLPLLIFEASEKNYRPIAAQYQITLMSISGALALGMHNAIMCSEDAPYYSRNDTDEAALDASYMGPMQLDAMRAICSVWPAGPVDDDFKQPLLTQIPALLLSGSADPITPPRYADMAARHFKKAWLLTGEHQGHGQLAVGCMPRIIDLFVRNAELDLPAGDADCFESSFVMPFFLDFAGPMP